MAVKVKAKYKLQYYKNSLAEVVYFSKIIVAQNFRTLYHVTLV